MMTRFACFSFLYGCAALSPAIKLAGDREEGRVIKNVEYGRGLINCPKGKQNDPFGTCEEMALLLDVYPAHKTSLEKGPLFPAILLAHGAANQGGSKDSHVEVLRANTYRRRGFVVFVLNYRLESHNGPYPGYDFEVGLSPWRSLYPAVRDVKAAARFIRAHADEFRADRQRIVASGVSAGGMDILTAFTSARDAFTKELSLEDDPTLNTTNLQHHAPNVKAMVVHSGPPWGIQQYERFRAEQPEAAAYAPAWKTGRATPPVKSPPPLIQFHGDQDELINVSNAHDTQEWYASAGVNSTLHVLEGQGHCSWTFGCVSSNSTYCNQIDNMCVEFIYNAFEGVV